jgi:ATP phosphoribosyltransferase
VLQELWSLAGIEPVGGRRPAEIAHRLVERAEAAKAGAVAGKADKVRAFLAVSDRPGAALDAIAALAGPNARPERRHGRLAPRLAGMAARGVPLDKATLAAAFGRAFGYYDGYLFEVRSAALGEERPVAAGGRYDGLPARLGKLRASPPRPARWAAWCVRREPMREAANERPPHPMIFAIPSKGRLKDQVEAWLAECGFKLEMTGGARGYSRRAVGPAGRVGAAAVGRRHRRRPGQRRAAPGRHRRGPAARARRRHGRRVMLLRALGFGRADLVVTAPKSWLDVDTMADIDEVGHAHLAKTGRRLRVATKYVTQTRAFFARHGVADYRIVESSGATEGAPAAGAAELVVDITTTGATLAANGLKILSDGVILKSQAQLTASLIAVDAGQIESLAPAGRGRGQGPGGQAGHPGLAGRAGRGGPGGRGGRSSARARAGPTAPCWRPATCSTPPPPWARPGSSR